jgi:hypothetical protein
LGKRQLFCCAPAVPGNFRRAPAGRLRHDARRLQQRHGVPLPQLLDGPPDASCTPRRLLDRDRPEPGNHRGKGAAQGVAAALEKPVDRSACLQEESLLCLMCALGLAQMRLALGDEVGDEPRFFLAVDRIGKARR